MRISQKRRGFIRIMTVDKLKRSIEIGFTTRRLRRTGLLAWPLLLLILLLPSYGLRADTYKNPIIADGADPWVIQKDGFYYYTQTTGSDIRIRKAAQITGPNGLTNASAVTVFTPPSPNNQGVWAPELHFLNGKWYIYYAADNGANANHRMFVAEANTSNPQGTYTYKGKIYDTANDRWAIDGTVLQMDDGAMYFIWSGWPGSVDGQQNLYIAPMSNPWTISGPRVWIGRTNYSWEYPAGGWGSWLQEGPQILKRNGKIFIIYSANGSWTDDYCLGMMVNTNGNVMDPNSWTKTSTPIFKNYSDLNGSIYGPGHCSFAKSIDGKEDFIFYHSAKSKGAGWNRSVRIQRFSWNPDDSPNFDVPIPLNATLTVPSGEGTPRTPETTYTLTVNTGSGGVRKSPEQLSYKPGSVVTLTAFDYQAYRFTGWTGDAWKTNHSITVTMDRNKAVTANFSWPFVLIDNPAALFTGAWIASSFSTNRHDTNYHYAFTSNSLTHTARFIPNLPAPGRYNIYFYYSSGPNRSASAPWIISDLDGTNTIYVNQQTSGNMWLQLAGERRFAQGTNGFVQLSNNTGESGKVVLADAVFFAYSGNQDVDVAPFIFSQPLSQTVRLGSNATLSVGAVAGTSYQWRFQDQIISGVTGSSLTISNFNLQHEGRYHVAVSNTLGTATSSNAWLRLGSPLRLQSLALDPSKPFHFQIIGARGSIYILEASENLQHWVPVETNLSINGFLDFANGSSSNFPRRFYRAVAR